MTVKKPLYLASSITELKKNRQVKFNIKNFEMLCKLSDKLYKATLDAYKTPPIDEEQVYLFCSRYLSLMNNIKLKTKDEKFANVRFGSSIKHIQDIRDAVEHSLSERYAMYKPPEVPMTIDIHADEEQHQPKQTILGLLSDDYEFVTVEKLHKLLSNEEIKVLVMDARGLQDFADCHIKHKYVINVPDEIITKGLSTNALQNKLDSQSQETFKIRHSFDLIVLMDAETIKATYPSSKLKVLRSILIDWDMWDQQYSILPSVLDGGIRGWVEYYPTFTTDANKIYNQLFNAMDELIYDDIEYPEDTPPPVTAKPKPSIPVPNRDTKPKHFIDNAVAPAVEKVEPVPLEPEISKDDLPSARVLHDMSIVARTQVDVENRLFKVTQQRIEIFTKMLSNRKYFEEGLRAIQSITAEVGKTESYRIELAARRNMLETRYAAVKTENDMHYLGDLIKDIETMSKETLLHYQRRKKLEIKEDELKDRVKREMNEYVPAKVQRVAPNVPDRRSKPGEMTYAEKLRFLKNKYRDSGVNGLINIKNTCYMNSLIQCLRFCPHFLYHLTTNHFDFNRMKLTHYTAELMKLMWENNTAVIRPNDFYNEVCRVDNASKERKNFGDGQHEDVHEFFVFMIDALHSELQKDFESNISSCSAGLSDWHKTFDNKNSFINKTFYYQMELTTSCPNCKSSYIKYEYGNTVFVNLPPEGNAVNLTEEVKKYTRKNHSDMESVKCCSKCERPMNLAKRVTYYPSVLVVNLVRYKFSQTENVILRCNNECIFQEEIFFGNHRYELSAVSLHSGNKNRGHYTALCKHFDSNRWIEFNDDRAEVVDPGDSKYYVQSYVFFYTLSVSDANRKFFHN